MTDVHCHVSTQDPSIRELLVGRDFLGLHPWMTLGEDAVTRAENDAFVSNLREKILFSPSIGIGEIGLDRLKEREISPRMREVFLSQLKLAMELDCPTVLHGAKCWGQVVKAVREELGAKKLPSGSDGMARGGCRRLQFLFHGFSRSDGLIPEIAQLGGFISVGPAVLNDHAVNYRELVKKIPLERLLVETDRTAENAATCPSIREVLAKTAELRGLSANELEQITDANANAFFPAYSRC